MTTIGRNSEPTRPAREALGEELRARRERLGMTQRDLSTITGISQGGISWIEQAHADPLVSSLITMAGAVGRRVELVGEHHLPLLDLTADELDALIDAAGSVANQDLIAEVRDGGDVDPVLRSALDKLTTTEENP